MSEQETATDLTDESGADHESAPAEGASRRGFLKTAAIIGGGLVLGAAVGRNMGEPAAASPRPKTAKEIADALIEGNRRFASGASQHPHLTADVIAAQATKQTPFAAILACADSRVSPDLVFDQGIGDLFVVRVAGNTGSAEAVASLAYAVEHLGVGFIMVLGHGSCGAVKATVDSVQSGKSAGEFEPLVAPIRPAVQSVDRSRDPGDVLSDAVAANAKLVAAGLPRASAILHEAIERRKLTIQAATYDVKTAVVTALTPVA